MLLDDNLERKGTRGGGRELKMAETVVQLTA